MDNIRHLHLYRAGYMLATTTPFIGRYYEGAPLDFPANPHPEDAWYSGHCSGVAARWYGVDLSGRH